MTTADLSPEEELIERAREHDAEAWTLLFDRHYASVYRYAYARLRSREEAEDVASQVFLEALKGIHSFHYRGRPLLAWLYRIARNLIVEHLRRLQRDNRAAALRQTEIPYAPAADESLETADLLDAIGHLTRDQQEVLILRFVVALPAKEVAQLLGKTEMAVFSLQVRAINALRRTLAPRGLAWEAAIA